MRRMMICGDDLRRSIPYYLSSSLFRHGLGTQSEIELIVIDCQYLFRYCIYIYIYCLSDVYTEVSKREQVVCEFLIAGATTVVF